MLRIIITLGFLLLTAPAFALTASWKQNTETDMKEYVVYMCKVKGCTVVQDAAQQVAIVPFNASVAPTWVLPNIIEGTLAVSARDTSGNESELSNQVPFDTQAPKAPTGALVTK
jgi:hypothetical protein